MKKINLIIIVMLVFFISSCSKENQNKTVNSCDTTNTVFNQLYNNILTSELITMDSYLHSYTFEVTSPATICKIGYRSQPTFEADPFLIEIRNNTTNALVYSGNHTFTSTSTEYVSITPVVLTVGNSYTVNRIQNINGVSNAVGRVKLTAGLSYPFTIGNLKITSSSFGISAGSDNLMLPYIDIVFE